MTKSIPVQAGTESQICFQTITEGGIKMTIKWRQILIGAILVFLIIYGAASTEACSTVIVGKEASITGEVLLGHNEDNGGRLVMPMYRVPRMQHAPGTMIDFGDGRAKIPQVEETWSYIWSETRSSGGASYSDGYLNEWGVAVASDNCGTSQHGNSGGTINEGGIGYGLRTIIAQRAKTAREGVLIAAELLETYGYLASGRAYAIVDRNEGWLFQAVRGEFYAAKRVPNDEVCFIPNKYTIHEVDLNDTENYICSPNLITYAIEKGWYTPAVPGDYSDFSFAKAYQFNWNNYDVRQYNALKFLTGTEPEGILPFSVKLDRKIGMEDVKALLRFHYEGTPDDLTDGYCCDKTPHYSGNRVICTSSTQESFVIQFREDPNFNVYWRATGNPCRSPYVPWYGGITRVPDGYGWLGS